MASADVVCRLWSSVVVPTGRMPGLTMSVGCAKALRHHWIAGPEAMTPSHPASIASFARLRTYVSRSSVVPVVSTRSPASRLERKGTVSSFWLGRAVRVSGRRRGANGRERHRLAQREKCDAVLDTHVDNG